MSRVSKNLKDLKDLTSGQCAGLPMHALLSVSLCTAKSGCCPEATFGGDWVALCEFGERVEMTKDQLKRLVAEARKRGWEL